MIGSLGDIIFSVSGESVQTFRDFTISAEARFATHELIGKKPLLEFLGPGLKTGGLTIRLDAANKGESPKRYLARLGEMRDRGEAVPLVIGCEYFGDFVLKSLTENRNRHSNTGTLITAEATLTLEEYADDRARSNA